MQALFTMIKYVISQKNRRCAPLNLSAYSGLKISLGTTLSPSRHDLSNVSPWHQALACRMGHEARSRRPGMDLETRHEAQTQTLDTKTTQRTRSHVYKWQIAPTRISVVVEHTTSSHPTHF